MVPYWSPVCVRISRAKWNKIDVMWCERRRLAQTFGCVSVLLLLRLLAAATNKPPYFIRSRSWESKRKLIAQFEMDLLVISCRTENSYAKSGAAKIKCAYKHNSDSSWSLGRRRVNEFSLSKVRRGYHLAIYQRWTFCFNLGIWTFRIHTDSLPLV